MRIRTLIILTLFLLCPVTAFPREKGPVEVLLFTSPHCRPCQRLDKEVVPRLKKEYAGRIDIQEFDFDKPENYVRLLELGDKYNWHPEKTSTPTVFIDGKFLVGLDDIKKYSRIYIDTALSKKGYASAKTESSINLVSRFKLFSPLAVIFAGLIDGINPCAFTVIIFFISFLALQGYGKRQILIIGLSFILAVFITYVLIGLGLFNFLFKFSGYPVAVKFLYTGGAIMCFILAGLAFYDFMKLRRTPQAQDLVLRLPQGLRDRIHRIIGLYYRKGRDKGEDKNIHPLRLTFSAFIVGFFISLFEAVCTGQVYLPTIVFVFKTAPLKLQALSYLLLYNLMFILPLWIIMLLALWGMTSGQFGRFAQRHMGAIKVLMMILFLSLGLFLIWQ